MMAVFQISEKGGGREDRGGVGKECNERRKKE